MTENLAPDILADRAARADGFVDFYELLGVPGDASQELINTRINEVYSRAQSNREHRHIVKRREAETLLNLMPHCMDVLMDTNNRSAYDAYAIAARASAAPTGSESFMNDVVKESLQARDGILGLREVEAATTVNRATNSATVSGETPVKRQVARGGGGRQLNFWVSAVVFIVAFVVCDLFLKLPSVATLAISPVLALLGALFTSRPTAPQTRARQRISA